MNKNRRFSISFVLVAATLLAMAVPLHAQSQLNATDYDMFAGNFNGEAKSEVLYIAKDSSWPSGMATVATPFGDPFFIQSWSSDYLGLTWSTQVYNFIVADFNGDTRSDILMVSKASGYSYIVTTNADGTLQGVAQTIAPGAFGLDWSEAQHTLIAGDFNGDGKADLFFQAKSSTGTNAVLLAASNGALFTAASGSCWSNGPHLCWSDSAGSFQGLKWSSQAAVVSTGDFNGDGKADFLVRAKPKIVMIDYDVQIPVPTYPPQMNGIIKSDSALMVAAFSVGTYFSRKDLGIGVDWSPSTANAVIGDFNNDGRADVLLQALRTGRSSFLFYGNANATLATGTTLASNVNWSADTVRLLPGYYGAASGTRGIYFQSVAATGISGFAQTITGTTVTLMGTGTTSDQSTGIYLLPGTGVSPVTSTGSTPGAGTVQIDGTGTYSIPIELPAGINALTPQLSIAYRHNASPGYLGPRWTITGFSAITRCPRNIAQNGIVGGLSYTTTDRYCLDGNQLRLTAGTGSYGATNSQYRTELETYSRITVKGTTATGPSWFEVYGKDGLIYEYGNTTDSIVTMSVNGSSVTTTWVLNKIRDRANNYINFEYFVANGAYTPAHIKYTGNSDAGVLPAYSVDFTLSGLASDPNAPYYVSNFLGETRSEYMGSISVRQTSTFAEVNSYRFSYYYGSNLATRRPLLASVQRCVQPTSALPDCLAPTTIRWRPELLGWGSNEGGTLTSQTSGMRYAADVNGDGYEDVIYLSSADSHWRVLWGSASGLNGVTDTLQTDNPGIAYAIPVDLDKNGSMDLLVRRTLTGNWYWLRRQSDGTFAYSDTTTPPGATAEILADVNGDGYEDLVGRSADTKNLVVRLHNDGAASFAATTSSYFISNSGMSTLIQGSAIGGTSRHRNMDIDGDGRQDIQTHIGTSWRIIYSTAAGFTLGDTLANLAEPIDLNSDPCTDLLIMDTTTKVQIAKCRIESGAGLYTPITTSFGVTPYVIDWDGDGFEDVLYNNSGTWWVAKSNGTSLQPPASTSITVDTSTNMVIADIDGNSRPDLIYTDSGNKWWARRNLGSQQYLVSQARDGLGNTVDYTYQPLAANSCYTPGTAPGVSSRNMLLTGGIFVACTLTISDGAGGTFTNMSSYSNALVHLQGRGFLGFATRRQIDGRTGVIRDETLSQAFPNVGTATFTRVKQSDDTTKISETTNTPAELTFGTGLEMTHFPYVQTSAVDSYEVNVSGPMNGTWISHQTKTVTLDTFGNATSTATTLQDKDSALTPLNQTFTTTVGETITNNTTNWCLGRSSQSQTSITLPDASSQTRTTARSIDYVACRVTQETLEPSTPALKVVKDFEYLPAGCGNVTAVTVTGYSAIGVALTPRTTHYNYSTPCRFPEQITDPLNQVTNLTYRYDLGLKQTMSDPNTLVTTWTYDNFGRMTREQLPDGTYNDLYYSTCSASAPCGASDLRMRVQSTERKVGGSELRTTTAFLDSYLRNRLTTVPLATGGTSLVERTYDQFGRVATQSVPAPAMTGSNGKVVYTYDLLGRQLQEQLRDGANTAIRTSKAEYRGRTLLLTDPRSNITTKIVDVAGQLRSVADPAVTAPSTSGTTAYQYTYEAGGVLKETITDALGNVAITRQNLRDFRTQDVDPDRGTITYEYDSLGELTKQTDIKGQQLTFGAYDVLGRPTTRAEPEGQTTWQWGMLGDNTASAKYVGKLKGVTISTSTYSEAYEYDQFARLKRETIVIPSDASNVIEYAYQTDTGLLDTLTYPTSTAGYQLKLKYEYQNGLPTKISDANALTTVFWQLNAVNALGNATDESLGSALRVLSSFDATTGLMSSRQAGVSGSTTNRMNLAYQWDATGNLTRRTDNNQSGLYESFAYDALDRLDSSTRNGTMNLDVTVDAIGNLTKKSDVSASPYDYTTAQAGCTYYSYSQPHAVRNAAGNSYCYDENGNMTKRAGSTINWTSYNLPSLINSGTSSSAFSYAPDRTRYKQASIQGGVQTDTVYVNGMLEKVTAGGVTAYRHYIAAGDSTAIYTRYSNSAPAQTFYIAKDHLNSFTSITDSSGAVVVSESFDAFGKRRSTNWTGAPTAPELTTIGNTTRRGFTGHEHLDNVGLIHMNGRVQDPTLGRFISADPLTRDMPDSQALNRYSYVRNNPLTLVDPSGFIETVTTVASRIGGEVDLPGDKVSLLLSDMLQSGISGAAATESQANGVISTVVVQASRITAARLVTAAPASLAILTVAGADATQTIENVTVVSTKLPNPMFGCESGPTCRMAYMEQRFLARQISEEELREFYKTEGEGGLSGVPVPPVFQATKWGIKAIWAARVARLASKAAPPAVKAVRVTLAKAIEAGLVKQGGKLAKVLSGIERGAASAQPKTTLEAARVVQRAASEAGLDAGVATIKPTGEIVLQNVGGVLTTIGTDGSILVTKGADVLLRTVP